MVRPHPRLAGGRLTLDIVDILYGAGDTLERPDVPACSEHPVGGTRRPHRTLGVQMDEGVQLFVPRRDPIQCLRKETYRSLGSGP